MKARHGLFLAAMTLAACGPGAPPGGSPGAATQYSVAEAGFDGPPRATALTPQADGVLVLSGEATADSEVRLASPQGRAFTVVADGQGVWRLRLPGLGEAALFGLSSRHEGRTVQAEGYIAVLRSPTPAAVLLRAGAGAWPIGPVPGALTIEAVDVDAARAAVVSGSAPVGATLNALVDGVASGEGLTNDGGRFTIALIRPLAVGPHVITVRQAGAGAVATARLDAAQSQNLVSGPYLAGRVEGAWRLDWMTPGGGVQTTVLFDGAGAGA